VLKLPRVEETSSSMSASFLLRKFVESAEFFKENTSVSNMAQNLNRGEVDENSRPGVALPNVV
jgi:hypothetical protein